nr:hypothetical protein [uncultured Oscillibacter sp.]
MKYSEASGPGKNSLELYGDSEFLEAVSRKEISAVLTIMDELMDTLRAVNIKVYDSVLRKIKAL